jgi:hypothetical protein
MFMARRTLPRSSWTLVIPPAGAPAPEGPAIKASSSHEESEGGKLARADARRAMAHPAARKPVVLDSREMRGRASAVTGGSAHRYALREREGERVF